MNTNKMNLQKNTKLFQSISIFGKQSLVTDIFESKWHPHVIFEVKMHKVLIFNDSHNLNTRIYKENNDQAISWDLVVISTWYFHNLTDDVIFILVSFDFMPCVEVQIACVHPLPPKRASGILIVCRILDIVKDNMITFNTMSLSECDETNQSIQSCYACFFVCLFVCFPLLFLLFYFLPLFFSQKHVIFLFLVLWMKN